MVRWADTLGDLPVVVGAAFSHAAFFHLRDFALAAGLETTSDRLRRDLSPPRLAGPSVPRWDSGFEPQVILGSGIRTLAPPVQA